MVPTLETPRLRLRLFREQDLERWSAVMGDPATMRFLGSEPLGREDSWRRMLMAAGVWALFGYGYWAVELKEDGRLIGQVGFADFKRAMTPSIERLPEAGWILAPDAYGQGYASEAVAAALDWADEALQAPEIVAIIDPANAASIRVAERTGFTERENAFYRDEPILLLRRRLPKYPLPLTGAGATPA